MSAVKHSAVLYWLLLLRQLLEAIVNELGIKDKKEREGKGYKAVPTYKGS